MWKCFVKQSEKSWKLRVFWDITRPQSVKRNADGSKEVLLGDAWVRVKQTEGDDATGRRQSEIVSSFILVCKKSYFYHLDFVVADSARIGNGYKFFRSNSHETILFVQKYSIELVGKRCAFTVTISPYFSRPPPAATLLFYFRYPSFLPKSSNIGQIAVHICGVCGGYLFLCVCCVWCILKTPQQQQQRRTSSGIFFCTIVVNSYPTSMHTPILFSIIRV